MFGAGESNTQFGLDQKFTKDDRAHHERKTLCDREDYVVKDQEIKLETKKNN